MQVRRLSTFHGKLNKGGRKEMQHWKVWNKLATVENILFIYYAEAAEQRT